MLTNEIGEGSLESSNRNVDEDIVNTKLRMVEPDMQRKTQDLELLVIHRPTRLDKTIRYVPKPKDALPTNPLPRWLLLPLDDKIPLVPAPDGTFINTRNEISKSLYLKKRTGFDTTDPYLHETPTEYSALHDPHLKYFFQTHSKVVKRLIDLGLLTSKGEVTCNLADLNNYRRYLGRIHKFQMAAQRKREDEWEGCEKKQSKGLESSIIKQLRLTRSDLRILRRLKILHEHERRAKFLREKWAEHPSNKIYHQRALDHLAAQRRREVKRFHTALRLAALREAQHKRNKRIIMHIVCEEDFAQKLRHYLCAEKYVNRRADLQNFVDNKRRYQEEKLRYHRALLRRERIEKKCRIESRRAQYNMMIEKQKRIALTSALKIKRKLDRELFLMKKYAKLWVAATLRSQQDGVHLSAWHVRNTLQEGNKFLKSVTKREASFGNILQNLFIGRKQVRVDPLKNADNDTKVIITHVIGELLENTYKELIDRLTNCLVDFTVEQAGQRVAEYLCREGIHPRDLQEPTITVIKRNQIRLIPPQRPCTGPCAQFRKGSDWEQTCGQIINELGCLREELTQLLTDKLSDNLRLVLDNDDLDGNMRLLEESLSNASLTTEMKTAIDTIAGIALDRASANPANSVMQQEFTDFATNRIANSITTGLTKTGQADQSAMGKPKTNILVDRKQLRAMEIALSQSDNKELQLEPHVKKRTTGKFKGKNEDRLSSDSLTEWLTDKSMTSIQSPRSTRSAQELHALAPIEELATLEQQSDISPVVTRFDANQLGERSSTEEPTTIGVEKGRPSASIELPVEAIAVPTEPLELSVEALSQLPTTEPLELSVEASSQLPTTELEVAQASEILPSEAQFLISSSHQEDPMTQIPSSTVDIESTILEDVHLKPFEPEISEFSTSDRTPEILQGESLNVVTNEIGQGQYGEVILQPKSETLSSPEELKTIDSCEEIETLVSSEGLETLISSKGPENLSSPEELKIIDSCEEIETLISSEELGTLISSKEPETLNSPEELKIIDSCEEIETLISPEELGTLISSERPETLISSEKPKILISSEEPKILISSEEFETLISSEEPGILISSEEPGTLISSEKPKILISSEIPKIFISSEEFETLISSEELGTLISSERPETLISSEEPETLISSEELEISFSSESRQTTILDVDETTFLTSLPDEVTILEELETSITSEAPGISEEQPTLEDKSPYHVLPTELSALESPIFPDTTERQVQPITIRMEPIPDISYIEEIQPNEAGPSIQYEISLVDEFGEPFITPQEEGDIGTPLLVPCDKLDQIATRLTSGAIQRASTRDCIALATVVPSRVFSGDWSRCVSGRASELVREAICNACIHSGMTQSVGGSVPNDASDESEKLDTIAASLTNRALEQARVTSSTQPNLGADAEARQVRVMSSIQPVIGTGTAARQTRVTSLTQPNLGADAGARHARVTSLTQPNLGADAGARQARVTSSTQPNVGADEGVRQARVTSSMQPNLEADEGARQPRVTISTQPNLGADAGARQVRVTSSTQPNSDSGAGSGASQASSGDWSKCISARASEVVRTAICAACGKIHQTDQVDTVLIPVAGISKYESTVDIESIAEQLTNKVLEQAGTTQMTRIQEPQRHVGLSHATESLHPTRSVSINPSIQTVSIPIESEESISTSSNAQILLPPRLLPTASNIVRNLTPSLLDEMVMNIDDSASASAVPSIFRAEGKLDVHDGMTRVIPSFEDVQIPAFPYPSSTPLPMIGSGTQSMTTFRHPGNIYPTEVHTEVQAHLEVIRAELDQLLIYMKDLGLQTPPPTPNNDNE